MNNNPKNNNLMSKNIRQKILTILEYFDASVCNISYYYGCIYLSSLSAYNNSVKTVKHDKSLDSNYVQLINELKSKFKMEVTYVKLI